MKPDIKAQWLTALRSGDYQQGRGHLRRGDQYCCLGVLCNLYGKAVGAEWDNQYGPDRVHTIHGSEYVLPLEVQKWAGVDSPNPLDLAARNDEGSSFQEHC